MHSIQNRLAGGVFALILALATFDVATARADEWDEGPVTSTTCGAGTLDKCGERVETQCEWDFDVNLNFFSKEFGIHLRRYNCRDIGTTPIYKDKPKQVLPAGTCDALGPALGLPAGIGCSDG